MHDKLRVRSRGAAARGEGAFTRLVLALFRAHGAVLAAGEELVGPIGLTGARWQVLGAVALAGTPLTVPAIAAAMGLTRQAVQKQVNSMSSDGLLALGENPAHARSPLVALTPVGSRLYARATERQRTWARQVGSRIPVGDLEDATRVLETIHVLLSVRSSRGIPSEREE